jgi:hypothetical protein
LSQNKLSEQEVSELETLLPAISDLKNWSCENQVAIFGFYSCSIYTIRKINIDEEGNKNEIAIIKAPISLAVKWMISQKILLDLNSHITKDKANNSFNVDLF